MRNQAHAQILDLNELVQVTSNPTRKLMYKYAITELLMLVDHATIEKGSVVYHINDHNEYIVLDDPEDGEALVWCNEEKSAGTIYTKFLTL